jgi:uncharacterized protein
VDIFDLGHQCAIIIGSDTPGLPRAYLSEAIAALERFDCVVGPTEDGGYYLIGARRDIRGRLDNLFADMVWSTETVMAETMERAAATNLKIHCLPQWYDIDTQADLSRLQLELAERSIDKAVCSRTRSLLLD